MVDRTIDETLAAVTAEDTRVDSIIAFVAGLKQQLTDALGKAITPDMQTKINQVFDLSTAGAAKVDVALNANVPPPPPAA